MNVKDWNVIMRHKQSIATIAIQRNDVPDLHWNILKYIEMQWTSVDYSFDAQKQRCHVQRLAHCSQQDLDEPRLGSLA